MSSTSWRAVWAAALVVSGTADARAAVRFVATGPQVFRAVNADAEATLSARGWSIDAGVPLEVDLVRPQRAVSLQGRGGEAGAFASVFYEAVWPGIDLVYASVGQQLKYTFEVAPGADPSRIRLAARGAKSIHVSREGGLEVETAAGVLRESAPYVFQWVDGHERRVEARFAKLGSAGMYGFALGAYDASLPLIVDPVIYVYSGFLGGDLNDWANAAAVDTSGALYLAGQTASTASTFPETGGPGLANAGGTDAYVAKISSTGASLVYAGYVGGSASDIAWGISVDTTGNAFIAGETQSTQSTFPEVGGPSLTHSGGTDAFVAKVDSTGTSLVFAGFLGGSNTDVATGVAVDASGAAYLSGNTQSAAATFPEVTGPFLVKSTGRDAFVAKVLSTGTGLSYCGYLGGTSTDDAHDVAVDASGAAHLVGTSNTSDGSFPTLTGPDTSHNGVNDAFVVKVLPSGTALSYSGYIGGTQAEAGLGCALDSSGNLYVTGSTRSNSGAAGFPATVGPDTSYNGTTDDDAFVAKVNSAGTGLVYCGYIGGSAADIGNGIAVDSAGVAHVAGPTSSTAATFPIMVGPDVILSTPADEFLARVAANGASLVYATYLGGTNNDTAEDVAIDNSGGAYVVGQLQSTESTFPVLVGPDLTFNGAVDTALTKLSYSLPGGVFHEGSLAVADTSSSVQSIYVSPETNTRLMLVSISLQQTLNQTVLSMTHNGDALTFLGAATNTGNVRVEMWYLIAPDTGTSNLSITLSAAAQIVYSISTYQGVDQSTPLGAVVTATGNSTTPSVTAVSSTNSLVADAMGVVGIPSAAPHASQATRWDHVTNANTFRMAGSTEPGAATVAMDWTLGAAAQWAQVAVGLNPANATAVKLESMSARQFESGVTQVEWQSTREVDNLGFHLYRESGGRRTRVTRALVAGSALFSAQGTLASGRSYAVVDPQPAERYWLEAIDLDGTRQLHGPVEATHAGAGETPRAAPSPGFAALSERSARPDDAVELGTRAVDSGDPAPVSKEAMAFQRQLAAGEALKLSITRAGLYRLGFDELRTAGLPLGVDPSTLQVFFEGREVPVAVEGDGLELFALGPTLPSASRNIYWLTWGQARGLRIEQARSQAASREVVTDRHTFWRRERSLYFPGLLNGEAENFFGSAISAEPVEWSVELSDLAAPGAVLELALQGVGKVPHAVNVAWNGVALGVIRFVGQARERAQFSLPAGLVPGPHQLKLTSSGGVGDVSLVESVAVHYQRSLRARRGALRFEAPAGASARVTGFASREVRVLDVTDPERPLAAPHRAVPEGEGFAAVVEAAAADRVLVAVEVSQLAQVAGVEANRPSRWHESEASDLLVVGPRVLLAGVESLIEHRRQQGLRVAVVDVDDVYDEASFGTKSPWGLKRFLAERRPKFVLLVGDATFDPRGHLGTGDVDWVPTRFVATQLLETASDDWFVDFDSDGLADVALGRFPVRSVEEAKRLTDKTLAHEAAASSGALLVAGENLGANFEASVAELAGRAGRSHSVETLYAGSLKASAGEPLVSALERGPEWVGYWGHGSVSTWADELLDGAKASQLSGTPTVVLAMTCLNGFFHDVFAESLAESLLRHGEGGAAAVWASTSLTLPDAQLEVSRAAIDALSSGSATLGEAILAAKRASRDPDVRASWVLLGDPSLVLSRAVVGTEAHNPACGCSGGGAGLGLGLLLLLRRRGRRRG